MNKPFEIFRKPTDIHPIHESKLKFNNFFKPLLKCNSLLHASIMF